MHFNDLVCTELSQTRFSFTFFVLNTLTRMSYHFSISYCLAEEQTTLISKHHDVLEHFISKFYDGA